MRATAVFSLLCVLTAGCHAASLSPQQIDDLHAQCQADPPGTPVVVFGASWCGACRIAAEYMTRERIPFVERDIEKDPAARAQANAALIAAGLRGDLDTLPVIDVRGTVIRGFDSCIVEQAWARP